MRKQTKLVAVLSSTAVLALGASMTSLAATNWVFEDGVWVYYNADGEQVTEEWKRSGADWYWLNEDGEMATDVLIEDDDDYYYVDESGRMVTNQWVAIENEDYDGSDEDDEEPVNHWYYFGTSGKAYQSSSTSSSVSWKTIGGEKYTFDDEGKMQFGWIDEEGERVTGDDDWRDGLYYCGDENDGARRESEWELLDITDNDFDADGLKPQISSENVFDDEEQERWFWFKSNGKKCVSDDITWKGNKYYFDEDGRMNAEWVYYGTATDANTLAVAASATNAQGIKGFTNNWMYFGDPADGARMTKDWFQAVPDEQLHEGEYDDGDVYWYYADKDGNLIANEIESIEGKKYAFDSYGRMRTGLRAIKLQEGSSTQFVNKEDNTLEVTGEKAAGILADDSVEELYFDTEDNFKANIGTILKEGYQMYYFDSDGVMQTGKQVVTIDGDQFIFEFNKSGSTKGQGKTGLDDDKYYAGGMLMAADKEDKYAVVEVTKDEDGKIKGLKLYETDEFLLEVVQKSDKVTNTVPAGDDADDYDEYYNLGENGLDTETVEYKLVNTTGKVQEDKSKAKDGDDLCFEVDNERIVAVFVED